ncbi:unnamed protein product [Brachionus calyciflorus]|uniref:Uncharacterized protein n=1 Tax=Brachionus calyciflorus TaxID=104777 RepID=A0A813U4R2_9BILA|nr:unnamed protein product [Brachionus calyciflorus]
MIFFCVFVLIFCLNNFVNNCPQECKQFNTFNRKLLRIYCLDNNHKEFIKDEIEKCYLNYHLPIKTLILENFRFNSSIDTKLLNFINPQITYLKVNNSNLQFIPNLNNSSLISVSFIHNKIKFVNWTYFPNSVEHLNLSFNEIQSVSSTLRHLSRLKIISLENNRLINIYMYLNSSFLSFLDLSKNQLRYHNYLRFATKQVDPKFELNLHLNRLESMPKITGKLNYLHKINLGKQNSDLFHIKSSLAFHDHDDKNHVLNVDLLSFYADNLKWDINKTELICLKNSKYIRINRFDFFSPDKDNDIRNTQLFKGLADLYFTMVFNIKAEIVVFQFQRDKNLAQTFVQEKFLHNYPTNYKPSDCLDYL